MLAKKLGAHLMLLLAVLLSSTTLVFSFGLMPVPDLKDVTVNATATYDPVTRKYSYRYEVTNPTNSVGDIWNIKINQVKSPRFQSWSRNGFTIPYGATTRTFDEMYETRKALIQLPPQHSIVPFGQEVPDGWVGGFDLYGYASFSAGTGAPMIAPGTTMSGFTIIGRSVPTIREMKLNPDWVPVVENHGDVTEQDKDLIAEIENKMVVVIDTLGPSDINTLGSDDHWSLLEADIEKAITLGWFTDQSLSQELLGQLRLAREALDQDDGTLAKQRLQVVLDLINASNESQRNTEVAMLVNLNALSLVQYTQDTPILFEPVFSLTPVSTTLAIGNQATITAKVINSANYDAPVPEYYVYVQIADGPHSGKSWEGETDINGEFTFSYTGTKVGTDQIAWIELSYGIRGKEPIRLAYSGDVSNLQLALVEIPYALAQAEVKWTGGPDLVVPFFLPPLVKSQGGNTVYVTEITENIGSTDAKAFNTRYYLSDKFPVDPNIAAVIGERRIDLLDSQEKTEVHQLRFRIPANLEEGTYYMAACADADNEIAELNEKNNCSFNKLETSASSIGVLEQSNAPPDCSSAKPGVSLLWPPNHKIHDIEISGVTDPDGDAITLNVISIRQDEPVNGLGDGDTSPDGFGVGTPSAQVRAERSGLEDGRVYKITFEVNDGNGGSCTGTVTVGVPHDQGKGSVPVDSGTKYDSTNP